MAFEEILQSISMEAAGDLSEDQYRFVVQSEDKTVALAGEAGGLVLGVNQGNVDDAGKAVQVGVIGISKVEAGDEIDVGTNPLVSTDASGRAVPAGTGDIVVGRAITSASAVGELIPVLLGYAGTA